MFSADDHRYMARALVLARRGQYSTPPNPSVGCVVVKDGRIAGEGLHGFAGGPHAEIVALTAAGDKARGATVYVTLEPCAHQGRTPPCTEALRAAGVARVVAAISDPNPQVAGDGLKVLQRAGITTAAGLLADDARRLNRGFLSRMTRSRPWVTLKIGASLDGRTALANGCSQWITGDPARQDVQRLRARSSATLTGIGTVLADDPRLTIRSPDWPIGGRRPLRVVLDSSLRTPVTARLAGAEAPTLIFTSQESLPDATGLLTAGVSVEALARGARGLDLRQCLQRLAELECNEVLVEAGSTLSGALLSSALVDEVVLYLAPVMLGQDAQAMLRLPMIEHLGEAEPFEMSEVRQLGRDLRLTLRPKKQEEDLCSPE